jgi:hypothetical protein
MMEHLSWGLQKALAFCRESKLGRPYERLRLGTPGCISRRSARRSLPMVVDSSALAYV